VCLEIPYYGNRKQTYGLLQNFSGDTEEQLVHDWRVTDPSHQKEYDDFAKIWVNCWFTESGAIDVNAECKT
jgi:hypothetical protein